MDEQKKTVVSRLIGLGGMLAYFYLSAHPDLLRSFPVRAAALHGVMLAAQKTAYLAGRVAIEAERAYRQVAV